MTARWPSVRGVLDRLGGGGSGGAHRTAATPSLSSSSSSSVRDSYADVVVPLEEAHAYSHAARTGRKSEYEALEEEEEEDDNDDDEDDEEERGGRAEGDDMLPMRACEYSIAGLRRVVRQSGDGRGGGGGGGGGGGKEGRQQRQRPSDYEIKSRLVNKAIQDIGMGRYNWQLFVLCGFGWFADNLWMQGVSLVLPSLSAEFGIAEKTVRYTTSALYAGLCGGSFFWGVGADVLGRRLAFNCTLLITGVFGTLAAGAGSWPAVCALVAALGFGVGGNLPVDGALFLEFLPDASSSLLTLLSVWWPVGQLCSSLLAWLLIGGGSNTGTDTGTDTDGWRTFVLTIGLVTFAMFFVRFFVFRLFESPKFLLARGRQSEAVAVIHGLAYRNGTKTWLTEEILDAVADDGGGGGGFVGYDATTTDDGGGSSSSSSSSSHHDRDRDHEAALLDAGRGGTRTSLLRDRLAAFSGARLRPLFQTRQLGTATALVWLIWATIGMGYPLFNAFLPQYLSHGGEEASAAAAAATAAATAPTASTYRSYALASLSGVPGSLLAAYTVDRPSPFLGRRGTLAGATLVSAVFLFLFAALGGRSAGAQLAFSCVEAFAQNIMYGVLYAFTPEMFPAPVRGAGTGVASFLNRVTGLAAPVLAATLPGDGATAPIYLSAALILAAFFAMVLVPIETRGRQRL